MTRANILLTRNGVKTVCVIDSSAYPESLPDILTNFDDWVSDWNEQRINAEYVYEIDFDIHTVRGWVHRCRNWQYYDLQRSIKQSLNDRIAPLLPDGWTVNDNLEPVDVNPYQMVLRY